MHSTIIDPIGAVWLIQHLKLSIYSPLYIVSEIGKSRITLKDGDFIKNTYQARVRPSDDIIAHLVFHLKHEIVSFELLYRVFKVMDKSLIEGYIHAEPTGQYARRMGFLYEWLTGEMLNITVGLGGNYVNVLNDEYFVVATNSIKDVRWRVNNNIAGARDFAPMVIKTDTVKNALNFDVKTELDRLNNEFGEDLILRSAVWITLRESRSSFIIEGEGKKQNRIERFATVMAEQVGKGKLPLDADVLARLQQEIIGKSLSIETFGIRQSPVFVGESNFRERQEIVHYIAPPQTMVNQLLQGLIHFADQTTGQSSMMRSAVVAFGFVYIHPLADGNGRFHRLLINDVLRRDGQTTDPIILPISKAIIEDGSSRKAYNEVLDSISKMVMKSLEGSYHFKEHIRYADGVRSNLVLDDISQTLPLWRYMDLTPHVVYLAKLIKKVINEDMPEESRYLRHYDTLRENIKNVIDMSNHDADRIIRSIIDNQAKRSNKLIKEYPMLADDELWSELVEVVHNSQTTTPKDEL